MADIIKIITLHAFILLLYCKISLVESQLDATCPCQIGKGKFRECKEKDPDKVWRVHYNTDVRLYGDCLPQVEENTMNCFRWRLADECGPNRTVKCALRHRYNLDMTMIPHDVWTQSITITSPGFNRTRPYGAYYNKNFCIYNVSLNCPQELVELTPTLQTTSLSDAEDCSDYLSFHVPSRREPVMKQLCGAEIMDPMAYSTIPSSNFYAVLWSNDNLNDMGKYKIRASCKTTEQEPTPEQTLHQGSGDGPVLITPIQ